MELIIILITLFARITDYIELDPYCIGYAVCLHNISSNILRELRPQKINIPIFLYTLANYQYAMEKYNTYFFPINVSTSIIQTVLLLMSYTTNWVSGTGKYNIKSLEEINVTRSNYDVVRMTSNKIYKIFQKEITAGPKRLGYTEVNNKYKIDGYYDVIYSTYIHEISENINLSLSSIINYNVLKGGHNYCYNNISWRPNIYKTFTYKKMFTVLDCFSSPIYPTIKPYCSVLPDDTFFDGCVGHFGLETLNRVQPDIMLAHPTIDPFTSKYCMSTIDKYLESHNTMAVITTQCTFGNMPNYVDNSSLKYSIISSYVLSHAMKSKNLLGFLIIPTTIASHSLIYTQNIRLTKSIIEIESAYIVLFYGVLPKVYSNLMSIKKILVERLRQNCDREVKYNTYKTPSRQEVNRYQREYQWNNGLNLYKEFTENIRLLKSYFNS
tara:strand:- start:1804 stop:3120 length:1317 start_codon:yes stop_codon:yes gene_type:complete